MKKHKQSDSEYWFEEYKKVKDKLFFWKPFGVALWIIVIVFVGIIVIPHIFNNQHTYTIYKNECYEKDNINNSLAICKLGSAVAVIEFNSSSLGKLYIGNQQCEVQDELCVPKEVDEINVNMAEHIGYVTEHPYFLKGLDDNKALVYIDGDLHFILKKTDITQKWLESNCECSDYGNICKFGYYPFHSKSFGENVTYCYTQTMTNCLKKHNGGVCSGQEGSKSPDEFKCLKYTCGNYEVEVVKD